MPLTGGLGGDRLRPGAVRRSLPLRLHAEREEKERRLMAAVDKLNLWGGRGTVRAATMHGQHQTAGLADAP